MRFTRLLILLSSLFFINNLHAQDSKQKLASSSVIDTVVNIRADTTIVAKDAIVKNKHIPAKATRRSAIIPGWGQAYNKEYWKIPIVYGALAVPASLFVYNN